MSRLAQLQSLTDGDRLGGLLGSDHRDLIRSLVSDDVERLFGGEDSDDQPPLTGVEHTGMKCGACRRTIRGDRFKCG